MEGHVRRQPGLYPRGRGGAESWPGGPRPSASCCHAMGKEELFPTVIHDGVLPRKTFSMGEAHDKRFYLEARKIRL